MRRHRERAVSVCVPTFNGASYVGEAIRSVLEQTVEDFELIVIDDGSSDGTPDVVAPEALRAKMRFLEENPSVGLVHLNVTRIDAHGGVLSEYWPCQLLLPR